MRRSPQTASKRWIVQVWWRPDLPDLDEIVGSTGGKTATSLGREFGRWVLEADTRDVAVAEVKARVTVAGAPQPSQWNVTPKVGIVRNLLGVTATGGGVLHSGAPPSESI